MSTLHSLRKKNVIKTWSMMLLFTLVVGGMGVAVSYYFDSFIITYVVFAIVIAWNFIAWYKSDKLVIKMTKAKEVKRNEHPDLWNMLENLSKTASIPMPKLYIIDDASPNAFATGRNPSNSAVVVTRGLLDILDKDEIEGVISHELAHITNRDTLIMTTTVVLLGVIAILSDIILHSMLFGGGRRDGNPLITIAVLLVSILLIPLISRLIHFAISRKREFIADATGSIYTKRPKGLASALDKISRANIPMKKASNATAHLFIANPFTEKKEKQSKWVHLFSTHPPVEERINALKLQVNENV